ncbi:MAG: DUF3592 domain-containing protein [Cytophagales bacterium]|nr:DUF3592 domain-containing protein [Cytophagales bacterium]
MKAPMIHALLLLVGFVLMGIAYWQFGQTMKLLKNGERAKARVLKLIGTGGDDGTSYRPLFEFVTKANQVQQFEYDVSSSPPAWEVGEEADVIYDPEHPQGARLLGYWGLFIGTIVLVAVAAPFIVIGSGYFLYVMAIGERSVL